MSRSSWLRRLAHGLLAGVLLSVARAPLGLDWTQLAVVQGHTAALFRAVGLVALALALDPRRPAPGGAGGAWLAMVAAGYAIHGLWLDATPGSRAGYVVLILVCTLLLRWLAGPRRNELVATTRAERIGLVAVGMGAALALEELAHGARLVTLATRADDTVLGFTFLVLLAVGAAAFGPLLARIGRDRVGGDRLRLPLGIALGTGAALVGLVFLSRLDPDGLFVYLRRLDGYLEHLRGLDGRTGGHLGLATLPRLDGASIGTLLVDLLLAAGAFVVPGFILGAALGATRDVRGLAHVCGGAALGLLFLPYWTHAHGEPWVAGAGAADNFAWDTAAAGALLSAVGACIAGLAARQNSVVVVAASLVAGALPWLAPQTSTWTFSPWSFVRVIPELVWPTPEGLLTVEPARDGTDILTLDRRRLTPVLAERTADEELLRLSWSLVDRERREGAVQALLIGQLTPARDAVLRSFGALELERTAPWHAAMPRAEELFFRAAPPPSGRIVSPAEARSKLRRGQYDWVVSLPVHGPIVSWRSETREIWGSTDGPRLTDLELGSDTAGVAWFQADMLAPEGTELLPILVHLDRLEYLSLGLVRGSARLDPRVQGPALSIPHLDAPSPWRFLSWLPQLRSSRIAQAASGSLDPEAAPELVELVRGLQTHLAAQELSSPYESRAQQVEIAEDALRAFLAAAPPPGELDPFSRNLWNSLAWALAEKRMVEEVLVYLEPIAERFAPWPALDVAVARAYREVLEPESALRFLERALRSRPDDIELLALAGTSAHEAGDPRAAEFFEQALSRQPGRPDLERLLGIALFQAGDARGRGMLERMLEAHPDDPELLEILAHPPIGSGDG